MNIFQRLLRGAGARLSSVSRSILQCLSQQQGTLQDKIVGSFSDDVTFTSRRHLR